MNCQNFINSYLSPWQQALLLKNKENDLMKLPESTHKHVQELIKGAKQPKYYNGDSWENRQNIFIDQQLIENTHPIFKANLKEWIEDQY